MRPTSPLHFEGISKEDTSMPPFKLLVPPGHRLPLIIAHVPHASIVIPPAVRKTIVLNDADLRREIVRLTDWHTDDLFSWIVEAGGSVFVNCLSRLVFDPERFADDAQEPMAEKGQGVVYTRTTDGMPLADIDPAERLNEYDGLAEIEAKRGAPSGDPSPERISPFSNEPLLAGPRDAGIQARRSNR